MTLFEFFEFFFLSGRPSGRTMGRPDGKATGTILGDFDRSEKSIDRSNKLLELFDERAVRTDMGRPVGMASGTISKNV